MKWEYKVENISVGLCTAKASEQKIQARCNALGTEGWELVSSTSYSYTTMITLIFKREKKEEF